MNELEKIREALSSLQSEYAKDCEKAKRKNHLTEQDHEMFNRIFDSIERENSIPLHNRVVTVTRVKRGEYHDVSRPIQKDKTIRRDKATNKVRRGKASGVLDDAKVSALSALQSRLRSLMEPDA